MDEIFTELLKNNKENIRNEFDYMVIYVYYAIVHHLRKYEIKMNILQLAPGNVNIYSMDHNIKSHTIQIKMTKKQDKFCMMASHTSGLVEKIEFVLANYIERCNQMLNFKNLSILNDTLYEFLNSTIDMLETNFPSAASSSDDNQQNSTPNIAPPLNTAFQIPNNFSSYDFSNDIFYNPGSRQSFNDVGSSESMNLSKYPMQFQNVNFDHPIPSYYNALSSHHMEHLHNSSRSDYVNTYGTNPSIASSPGHHQASMICCSAMNQLFCMGAQPYHPTQSNDGRINNIYAPTTISMQQEDIHPGRSNRPGKRPVPAHSRDFTEAVFRIGKFTGFSCKFRQVPGPLISGGRKHRPGQYRYPGEQAGEIQARTTHYHGSCGNDPHLQQQPYS
ncbi:unnamed protein product [Rotaria socialis]|uniref:Uncharacterized protein n=1 Tax=Rotaria socialis TaxID=392032 RepID=A0A819B9D5_9BILA|nr:unnamed protein product [Rotaria socialis]CAF4910373.1 unnamed protein product [Rotaria socialis]